MKKLLLPLGAIASIVAPVASVVACDSTNNGNDETILEKITDLSIKNIKAVDSTKTLDQKIEAVNDLIADYIAIEGFGWTASDRQEDSDGTFIEFVNDGFLVPVAGRADIQRYQTPDETKKVGATKIAAGDLYVVYHDDTMGTLSNAYTVEDFPQRAGAHPTIPYEVQLTRVINAAADVLAA